MKVPGASRRLDPRAGIGSDLLLRRARYREIAVDVVGCSTVGRAGF
jgi:hypothetical protein